jgi:hypothetical protein
MEQKIYKSQEATTLISEKCYLFLNVLNRVITTGAMLET